MKKIIAAINKDILQLQIIWCALQQKTSKQDSTNNTVGAKITCHSQNQSWQNNGIIDIMTVLCQNMLVENTKYLHRQQ